MRARTDPNPTKLPSRALCRRSYAARAPKLTNSPAKPRSVLPCPGGASGSASTTLPSASLAAVMRPRWEGGNAGRARGWWNGRTAPAEMRTRSERRRSVRWLLVLLLLRADGARRKMQASSFAGLCQHYGNERFQLVRRRSGEVCIHRYSDRLKNN